MSSRSDHPTSRRVEGRRLARPDRELVDQGLAFDVDTIVSRRRVLGLFGIGAGVAGIGLLTRRNAVLASTVPAGAPAVEIPEETAGPFPGDGSNGPDVLEQSGIIRRDITTSFGGYTGTAEGVPVTLELTVYDLAKGGVPFEGAAVYAWHCTREGGYSLYSEGLTEQNFLRGVQIADADGKVAFATIFPGCYAGRWPHVHFEVYADETSITDAANAIATSQLAVPAEVCALVYSLEGYERSATNLAGLSLETDGIFADDHGATQLATVTGDVASGLHMSLPVSVDTTTDPGARRGRG